MHIVFFTHYFPPEGNAPASRTYDHCVRWVKKGVKVTVITCAPNVPNGKVYKNYENKFFPQRESLDGIDVIRVGTIIAPNKGKFYRITNYISYLISALFAFVFYSRRPDLIIATSPQFFCGWTGTIASYLKWRPFVLEIRDIWPESIVAVEAMQAGFATRCLEVLEKWMYKSATHIVAVGNGYKQSILKRVPKLQNISVVTNGVDLEKFTPQPPNQEFLGRWDLTDKFVCSYVGTIGMAHGLSVVLDAAARLKQMNRNDIKFCLVGAGADKGELAEEVKERNLESSIVFTGRLPKSDMETVLASSDAALIHLKPCELFTTVIPSKIFETMAMSRPIIMGVDGEAREIVQASKSGIDVNPGDGKGLADAVCRLADDPLLCRQLASSGRSFVAQNFTRDRLADEFLEILKAVQKNEKVEGRLGGTSSSHFEKKQAKG